MNTISVPACKANAQNFHQYGCVLEKPRNVGDYEDAECRIWYDMAPGCDFSMHSNINYYFLKKAVPSITQLFRVATDEAYFNTNGGRIACFAADSLPDGRPDVSSMKAFCIDGESFLLKAGVWRTQPFSPDRDNVVLLLMDKHNVYFDENGDMKRDRTRVVEYDLSDRYIADLRMDVF